MDPHVMVHGRVADQKSEIQNAGFVMVQVWVYILITNNSKEAYPKYAK
jgi:hypothetical protein